MIQVHVDQKLTLGPSGPSLGHKPWLFWFRRFTLRTFGLSISKGILLFSQHAKFQNNPMVRSSSTINVKGGKLSNKHQNLVLDIKISLGKPSQVIGYGPPHTPLLVVTFGKWKPNFWLTPNITKFHRHVEQDKGKILIPEPTLKYGWKAMKTTGEALVSFELCTQGALLFNVWWTIRDRVLRQGWGKSKSDGDVHLHSTDSPKNGEKPAASQRTSGLETPLKKLC